MNTEGEELVLFSGRNNGGYVLELVAHLRRRGNIRYFLRSYHEDDEPESGTRYDPTLADFRDLGIQLLGLSELAKGNLYLDESGNNLLGGFSAAYRWHAGGGSL